MDEIDIFDDDKLSSALILYIYSRDDFSSFYSSKFLFDVAEKLLEESDEHIYDYLIYYLSMTSYDKSKYEINIMLKGTDLLENSILQICHDRKKLFGGISSFEQHSIIFLSLPCDDREILINSSYFSIFGDIKSIKTSGGDKIYFKKRYLFQIVNTMLRIFTSYH